MKKANHLIKETSPYLLQHAYNPVEWYAWSEEAFERAKKEDKPILVSIGYAACHWCHVMEHESFENVAVAEFMNDNFINIKVDREERPDIDNIYMQACQLLTGSGGWPLNVFLTPDRMPFSGGTYFPPKHAFGKPAWIEVLTYMRNVFLDDRDKVEVQARTLSDHISALDNAFINRLEIENKEDALFNAEDMQTMIGHLKNNFDTVDGGIGNAPKFPSAMVIGFLIKLNFFRPDFSLENYIHLTLKKMMQGGIFDQAGGGFSRYTVDKKWMIPHFEKMLYDNALLLDLYAEAYSAFKKPEYLQIVKRTAAFLSEEMMDHDGYFYASFDADSEGVEGKYYTFTKGEIDAIFGELSAFVCRLYAITETGNWEHTNILFRNVPDAVLMQEFGLSEDAFNRQIKSVNEKLFAYRSLRVRPALDKKAVVSWNALACSGFINAFKATGDSIYREIAIRNIQFLLSGYRVVKQMPEMLHVFTEGKAKYPAFIDDYAALIKALIDVYEVTGNANYIEEATAFSEYVLKQFAGEDGMFFFTSSGQADIPIRNKDFYDTATPSGNALMFENLFRLSVITGNKEFHRHAVQMMGGIKETIIQHGVSFGKWLTGTLYLLNPVVEVAVTGKNATELIQEIAGVYYPGIFISADATGDSKIPIVQNRFVAGKDLIYVCRDNTCGLPLISVSDFITTLAAF